MLIVTLSGFSACLYLCRTPSAAACVPPHMGVVKLQAFFFGFVRERTVCTRHVCIHHANSFKSFSKVFFFVFLSVYFEKKKYKNTPQTPNSLISLSFFQTFPYIFIMSYSQVHVAQRLSFSENQKKRQHILPITAFYSRFRSVASAVTIGSG